MLVPRPSRLFAHCCATFWGLVLLGGCGSGSEQTSSTAPRVRTSQPASNEPHGPAFVNEMLRLTFVGCVDRTGPESPARQTLVHLRNVRYRTLWEFEANSGELLSEDELNRTYETFLRRLSAIQAEQAELMCWFQSREGGVQIWDEDVTDESLPLFRKLAADGTVLQNDPGLRLRLGGVGRLLSAGLIDVRPLPAILVPDTSDNVPEDREAREDALVRRIMNSGGSLSVLVLAGDRDLRDNFDRLGQDDWELLTVDVQAYVRFASPAAE